MAEPTDDELKARKMTRRDYDLRNALWHKMLRQMPPDERERINENIHGLEALSLAAIVEMKMGKMIEQAKAAGVELDPVDIRRSPDRTPLEKILAAVRGEE